MTGYIRVHSYVPFIQQPPPLVSIPIEVIKDYLYLNHLKLEDTPIGQGVSSQVYRLSHENSAPTKKVMKVFNCTQQADTALATRRFNQNIGDHLAIPFRHPHILEIDQCLYYDANTDTITLSPTDRAQIIAVIMPEVNATPLRWKELQSEMILPFAAQLASAIAHLNANKIVHGDLCPDNILTIGKTLLLIDFGLAHKIPEDGSQMPKGREAYMAPEIYQGQAHTVKADAWAFGILFYQMLHQGKLPSIDSLEINPSIPEDLQSLLKGLLEPNPEARLSIYAARRILIQEIS